MSPWVKRSDITTAVCMAAALAGPVFMSMMLLTTLGTDPGAMDVETDEIWFIPIVFILSVPFGFAFAILPCFGMAHALLGLARLDDGSLNPATWLMAGASSSAAIGYVGGGASGVLVMALVGAFIAMFTRAKALDLAEKRR